MHSEDSQHLQGFQGSGARELRIGGVIGRVTYIFMGHDEKKKEYRLDSAQNFDRASRSKNSPIGIPHNLCKRRILYERSAQSQEI